MLRFLANLQSSPSTTVLGISSGAIAWLQTAPSGSISWQHHAWEPDATGASANTALEAIRLQLPSSSASFTVLLAPSVAQHWLQTSPAQTASLTELHAIARSRASVLFGRTTNIDWDISANWQANQAFLCTGVPRQWSEALLSLSTDHHKLKFASPLTLVLTQFKKLLPAYGWLALVASGVLNLLQYHDSRIISLRTVRLTKHISSAECEVIALAEWRREMLRVQSSATQLSWLNLAPHADRPAESKLLTTISWTPLVHIPALPTPFIGESTDAQHAAIREALLTAWCGNQCGERLRK